MHSLTQPTSRVLRLGLHSGQQYETIAELISVWRRAESLGYDWVSMFDHWRPVLGGPDGSCLDGPIALTAAALATSRVVAGLMVTPAFLHNPGLLAHRIVSLDHVTAGRLVIGLGAGSADRAYEQFGLDQPSVGTRVGMLEECLPLIRRLMRGEVVDHEGQYFRLREARIRPGPVQDEVPIAIGASAPRMLRIAGRYATVWNTVADTSASYAARLEQVRAAAAAVGRGSEDVRASVTFRAAIGSSRRVAELRQGLVVQQGPNSPDISEFVSWGSAQECLEALHRYVEAGARDLLLAVRPPIDWESVEAFATNVAPKLRELQL